MKTLSYLLLVLAIIFNCADALYPTNGDVVELTPSNFDKLVLQDDAIWIVEFYAPWCGHCKNLVPEYKKAAKALKGVVKVGAVNADDHKSLGGQYGVQGFPTIKIFGQNKRSPIDFNGQRTAQGIAEAGLAEAKKKVKSILGGGGSDSDSSSGDSKDVVELTDDNFDKLVLQSDDVWLVEFFAPWCGHCKNLAPHWAKAATELKGKVKLGALDATVHQAKAQQYGVNGYPTIKFFPGGRKSSSDAEDYTGGRTSSDIVSWALEKYSDSIPAPELIEIIDEKSFDSACDNKPLCVVSVLPHILDCDAKCRNKYLDMLKTLGEKYKKKLWGWAWAEGAAQLSLEESLEIGGFGYPAMAVVNFKKMKFSVLKGSFSKEGVDEFLRDISYGRGNTAPVRGAKKPKINKTEPWDGKDGKLPEIEDIDLSDVDLDEKDEL
ncbi:protein disulfide-isomerase A6 homolog [Condylostylus longicornis]|uniref:protein disulfide-isomerase A6 homolog n=1 Tax=Condylostylus longicornis TaxID=2530218 RepID=UPI00244DEFAA|nr:protein disulfide-isomerase A6 homolog [Condylostylus longicornis]